MVRYTESETEKEGEEMGNKAFKGLPKGSHSVVVLVNFRACRCSPSLLKGERREELLGLLRKAVEDAGFGVVDGDIQPFGRTMKERNQNGATLNLILEDVDNDHGASLVFELDESGISFDCYPEVATVQMNLHYCNITNSNDHKVPRCIANIRAVLCPDRMHQFDPIVMPIADDEDES